MRSAAATVALSALALLACSHAHGFHGHEYDTHVHEGLMQEVDAIVPHGKAHTFACGVGDPRMGDALDREPIVSEQTYHDLHHPEVHAALDALHEEGDVSEEVQQLQRRRLSLKSQQYPTGPNSAFLTAAKADAVGKANGIRIVPLWDPLTTDTAASGRSGTGQANGVRQCSTAGEQVWNILTNPTPHVCEEADIPTQPKIDIMKTRTTYAGEYFSKALKVKSVLDNIQIGSALVNEFKLSVSTVADADLVVVMTARPAKGLNGYALCLQTDQNGRCTVGQFNWVPTVISETGADDPDTINAQRHTALHEMVHVLGGIGPNAVFVKEDGTRMESHKIWVSKQESLDYPKTVTQIKTPKVLKLARDHFDCQELDGVSLEDQPTGKVAHWEARILGPELMSYGTGTGETFFGDITFAFLEDTNQYVANYSLGGRLIPYSKDTTAGTLEFDKDVEPAADFKPPFSYPDGSLTWGRKQGCSFVTDSAKTWNERYFCKKNREFHCTPDNKMSAVCSIVNGWAFNTRKYSCGDCPGTGNSVQCSPRCTKPLNDNCVSATNCALPSMYVYFNARDAATAMKVTQADPNAVGGFSSAMDFAPVRVGYWNCGDSKAGNGTTGSSAETGGAMSVGSLLGSAADDMKLFGGQAYCPTCRCFKSSLADFSSGKINPNLPTYGLCYRSNCYKEDYLQFAIESQLGRGSKWYKCPSTGGKIYLAGFAGAFHCPDAKEFCRMEAITGIKYKESDPFWEWVYWSVVLGIPLLIMITCAVPCLRNYCVGRAKKKCGVNHFTRHGNLDLDAEVDSDTEETPPVIDGSKWPTSVLKYINGLIVLIMTILFFILIAAFGSGRASVAGAFLLVAVFTILGFSYVGYRAGTKSGIGTSCAAVSYLYILFFGFIFFAFAVLYTTLYPESLGKSIARQWPVVVDTMPEGMLSADTVTEDKTNEIIKDNSSVLSAVYLLVGVIIVSQFVATLKIVTIPVFWATAYSIINYIILFIGVAFWAIAGYTQQFAEATGTGGLVAIFAVLGCFFVLFGFFNLRAILQEKTPATVRKLCIALGLNVILLVFMLALGFGVATVVRGENSVLDQLTDEQVAKAADIVGIQGSRQDVEDGIKDNLRTVAVGGLCVVGVLSVLVMSNMFLLSRVKRHFDAPPRKGGRAGRPVKGRNSTAGRV